MSESKGRTYIIFQDRRMSRSSDRDVKTARRQRTPCGLRTELKIRSSAVRDAGRTWVPTREQESDVARTDLEVSVDVREMKELSRRYGSETTKERTKIHGVDASISVDVPDLGSLIVGPGRRQCIDPRPRSRWIGKPGHRRGLPKASADLIGNVGQRQ